MAYVLPDRVIRCTEPKEIEVDGVKLLVRELSPQEYAEILRSEVKIVNGQTVTAPGYVLKLIENCVVEPEIHDANILTAAFAGNLANALDRMMGNNPDAVKNE